MKPINSIKIWFSRISVDIMQDSNQLKNLFQPFKKVLNLCFVLTFLHAVLFFTGCDNYEMESPERENAPMTKKFPGVYPKSKNSIYNATRCGDAGYWESWKYFTLYTGQKVNMPWNTKSTNSSVPHDILEDIKYDDGWDLIFHLLECNSGTDYTLNSPYLIFHNRYTGILKVFYYATESKIYPNNHGIWEISTETPSSLFAFQNDPVSLISQKQNEVHFVSTITKNSTGGFASGWNCFQIEMAYDPSQSGWLNISTRSSNTIEITFTGNLEANTSGLISSSKGSGGSSSYGSGVAKIAGDKASEWIEDKISDKTIKKVASSLINDGVKALVSGGVGSVLSAITGLFRSDDTSTSLQLTTNGTFTCDGTASFVSTTGIEGLELCLDPDSIGYLGAWGLVSEPTLKFSPYAVLKSPQEYTNGYTREYDVSVVNRRAMPTILINPELSQFIKSSEIVTTYYQAGQPTRRNIWGNSGATGRDSKNLDNVYEDLYMPNFNIIADVAFKGDENAYLPVGQFEAPMEVFIPNVPNGPTGAVPNFIYHSKYVASVGVHFTLPNGSESYSFHRCVPYVDWNLSEYNNGLYWYLYPCEPIGY